MSDDNKVDRPPTPIPQQPRLTMPLQPRTSLPSGGHVAAGARRALYQHRESSHNTIDAKDVEQLDEYVVPIDMAAEIKDLINGIKDHMYTAWSIMEDLRDHINRSGDRLTKNGMRQINEPTKPEAWLNKQTDDLQLIWEKMSDLERTFEASKQDVATFKTKVP